MVLAVIAELHIVQATPQVGADTEALAIVAIPGPLPTVPHVVLPIAHCPSALLDQIGAQHPSGTTRMLVEVIKADSITTGSQLKASSTRRVHLMVRLCFYTHLQLPAQDGTKTMIVKIDPGTQVNTIPLSRYQTLFPKKNSLNLGTPRPKPLCPHTTPGSPMMACQNPS